MENKLSCDCPDRPYIKGNIPLSAEVYRCYATGLGDVCASLMLFHRWSLERRCIIRVSTWYPKGEKKKSYEGKARELLALIKCPGGYVELVDDAPTEPYPTNEDLKYQFYPFYNQWTRDQGTKIVTYQFDGKSHAEKNFDSFDAWERIENHLRNHGYTPVKLGAHLSIEQCAQLLAMSEFYIGVPSGMGVLSFGTGTPYYMIRNGLTNIGWLKSIRYGDFMILNDEEDFYSASVKGGEFYYENCINPEMCR